MTQTADALYTPEGTPATFDDPAAAAEAVRSGKAGAIRGTTVNIRFPDGAPGTVPSQDLAQALRAGATLATAQDVGEQQVSKLRDERQSTGLGRYEQVVNAATGLTGLAMLGPGSALTPLGAGPRSALGSAFGGTESQAHGLGREDAYTFGLGKLARKGAIEALYGKEAADKYVTEAKLTRALEPEAYQRGSIEGGVESALATGAAGKAGGLMKFLGGAQAVPEMAGALTEAGLVRAGLAGGKTALSQAVRGAAMTGMRAGVENAIVGGASELTEEMFGDPEVSGEKVWLAAGKGALSGLAIGAAMGAVSPLVSKALRKTADAMPEAVNTRLSNLAGDADEKAFRALSSGQQAPVKVVREAEARVPGGTVAVGKVARDTGIVDLSSPMAAIKNNTPDKMAARAIEKADELGSAIGDRMRMSSVTISGHEIDEIAQKLLNTPDETGLAVSKQAGRGNVANALRSYVDDLLDKGGMLDNYGRVLEQDKMMTMADAFAQRRALDQKIYKDYSALEAKGPMELMRKFRAEFDDLLMRKMEAAGETGTLGLGPAGSANTLTLKELKHQYAAVITAKKLAEDAAIKEAKNRGISLTDYISGAASYGVMGDPVTGLLAARGHKLVRERGNAVAAWALDRISTLGGVGQAVQQTDRLLEDAARAAAGERRLPYRSPPPSGSLLSRYNAAAEHVTALAQNADAVKSTAMQRATIGGAPRISDAYAGAIARAASALVAKLPAPPPQTTLMHKPRPTDAEMTSFLSAYDAAMDPQRTLREVAAGSLDPTKLDTLKAVAPQSFATLRDSVEAKLHDRIKGGDVPGTSDLMKLHLAFGITVDPTMTPQALLSQQQAMAGQMETPEDQVAQEGQGPARGGNISLDHLTQPTGPDRFER